MKLTAAKWVCNRRNSRLIPMNKQFAIAFTCALALACGGGGSQESGAPAESADAQIIKVDGSSTVYPITEAVAEEFGRATNNRVTVGISGTGGGFQKFCRDE